MKKKRMGKAEWVDFPDGSPGGMIVQNRLYPIVYLAYNYDDVYYYLIIRMWIFQRLIRIMRNIRWNAKKIVSVNFHR